LNTTEDSMTKQEKSKTVALLDVVTRDEVCHHPMRSLLALADRVIDEGTRAKVLQVCGEEAYCRLMTVLAAPEHRLDEKTCRDMAYSFSSSLGCSRSFFCLLNDGQLELTKRIESLAIYVDILVDSSLTYAPCGLSSAPAPLPTDVSYEQMAGRADRFPTKPLLKSQVLNRAVGRADRLTSEVEGLQFMLLQGGIQLGTVTNLHRLAIQVAAQIRKLADSDPPAGSSDGRTLRYMSADEHQFLELATKDAKGIVTYDQTPSGVAERMHLAGLVDLLRSEDGTRRAKITVPGRRAMETWHYEVLPG
jgi:hypothetical protein